MVKVTIHNISVFMCFESKLACFCYKLNVSNMMLDYNFFGNSLTSPCFFVFHCCNEVLRSHNVPLTSSADRNISFENCCGCLLLFCFFSIRVFFHGLTTHRTAGELKGPSFIPLCHFHPLMNIQIYICNSACEMIVTYF